MLSAPVLEQPPAPPQPKPEPLPKPMPATQTPALQPKLPDPPDRPLPITLTTALRLAAVAPLDVAIAGQRLEVAAAQLQRANRLWLPTLLLGGDYFRHDGQLQDVGGAVFGTSKSTMNTCGRARPACRPHSKTACSPSPRPTSMSGRRLQPQSRMAQTGCRPLTAAQR